MINGNTALLHIGNFDTGKRTNLKRAVSECVYTSRLYYNITETEYDILRDSVEDKEYFKYLLYTLGIVDRWKQESLKAIKQLEALTGDGRRTYTN